VVRFQAANLSLMRFGLHRRRCCELRCRRPRYHFTTTTTTMATDMMKPTTTTTIGEEVEGIRNIVLYRVFDLLMIDWPVSALSFCASPRVY
jgi:hypothetical protein